MIDDMANHAARMRRHMARSGQDVVEDFIDTCLSLENLIDPIPRTSCGAAERPKATTEDEPRTSVGTASSKGYMDLHQPARVPRGAEEEEAKRRRSARAGSSPSSRSATSCCS